MAAILRSREVGELGSGPRRATGHAPGREDAEYLVLLLPLILTLVVAALLLTLVIPALLLTLVVAALLALVAAALLLTLVIPALLLTLVVTTLLTLIIFFIETHRATFHHVEFAHRPVTAVLLHSATFWATR